MSAGPVATAGARESRRREVVAVVCLIGIASLLEWHLLATHRVPVGADQELVGLMARHILAGEHPVFYWGATYAGSLEPHYVAFLFGLFGSSMRVYHVGMAVLIAGLMLGVAGWTARAFGLRAGLISLIYLAFGPFFFFYKGLTSDGAYDAVAILSLLEIAFAWSADSRRIEGRPFAAYLFLLGGAAGVAFWVMPHTAALSAAVVAWVAARGRLYRAPRALALLSAGALAGSWPWWIWNLRHGWASLWAAEMGAVSPAAAIRNLSLIVSGSVPALEGGMATSPWPELFHETFPGSRWLAILLVVVVVAMSVSRARTGSAADQLLLAGLGAVVVAASLSARLLPNEPRYLVAYYVLFPPLLGAAFAPLVGEKKRRALLVSGAALGLILHTSSIARAPVRDANVERDVAGDLRPLIAHLSASGIDRVYANYWTAYRLAFESGERIIASPLPMDQTTRYAPYLEKVNAAPDPGFVLLEPRDSCFGTSLQERGVAFRRSSVGEFGVYSGISAAELASIRKNLALPLPDSAYRVAWTEVPPIRSLEAGGTRPERVGYRNEGPCIWPITVHLGYHWWPVDPNLQPVFNGGRGFAPGPVGPGQQVAVRLPLSSPSVPGRYRLQWDLVNEGVNWFSTKRAPTADLPFTVLPRRSK